MNLLILISDEHRRDAMSCAGHPVARTPALGRLAGQRPGRHDESLPRRSRTARVPLGRSF